LSGSAKEDKEYTSMKSQIEDDEKITEKRQKQRDDLQMYEKYFPEQFEYQVL
jgi:hypothetical protein